MARRPVRVMSHWHRYLEEFSTSAMDFYQAVEAAVKARELPEVELSRVEYKEGGALSAKREYLRIRREGVAFDLCAAPYGGRGYFFSWWMAELPRNPLLWLLATAGLVLGFLLAVAILWKVFSGSCAGIGFFILLVVFGIPAAILALGYGVREGAIASEEQVLAIPVLGWLYERIFQPITYYRLDTALMFQEAVRASVNDVLDSLFSEQGLRAMAEEEKAPHHELLR